MKKKLKKILMEKVPAYFEDCINEIEINELEKIKPISGLYFLCWLDSIVYIGRSKNILLRIITHQANKLYFDSIFYIPFPDNDYLKLVETACINSIKPPDNRRR